LTAAPPGLRNQKSEHGGAGSYRGSAKSLAF
jgi:hypothetical protein